MQTAAGERPSLLPVIIGLTLAALSILALGLWVAYRQPEAARPPVVRLISPGRDTMISGPLPLVFSTSGPLRLRDTGWGLGRYHLHALVGPVEIMPGPRDIVPLGSRRYRWVLAPLRQADTVRLTWSLPNHRRLERGGSAGVLVTPR